MPGNIVECHTWQAQCDVVGPEWTGPLLKKNTPQHQGQICTIKNCLILPSANPQYQGSQSKNLDYSIPPIDGATFKHFSHLGILSPSSVFQGHGISQVHFLRPGPAGGQAPPGGAFCTSVTQVRGRAAAEPSVRACLSVSACQSADRNSKSSSTVAM